MTPIIFVLAVNALLEVSKQYIEEVDAKEIENIVAQNSVAAAIAGVGAGWLPGAGGLAASAAWVAAIWTLYMRINKALGIRWKGNVVKSIASAMLTNILAAAGGLILAIVGASILSLVPGLGTAGAVIIDGMIGYITVFASGILYLKMLTLLFKAKGDIRNIEEIGEADIKNYVDETVKESNMNDIINEAKDSYKAAKKEGKFDKKD